MTIASAIQDLNDGILDAYDAVSTKGGPVPADKNIDNLPTAINSISGGGGTSEEKDVNFYDYDGTLLHSYTKTEFLALTEMPANPDRTSEGLTAEGWNWTLANAKAYFNAYDGTALNIGQTYYTTDGKTHIFIKLENFTTISLGTPINGTVTVDWGDGNTESITASEGTSSADHPHTYATTGEYEIKLAGDASNTYGLCGGSSGSTVIWGGNTVSGNANYPYRATVKKVYAANTGVVFGSSAFYNCYALTSISIPNSVTSIESYAFNSCYALTTVEFDDRTTVQGWSSWLQSSKVDTLDFTDQTTVPTLSSTSFFTNMPTYTKIVVPDSLYDQFIVATNWSQKASQIVKESEA